MLGRGIVPEHLQARCDTMIGADGWVAEADGRLRAAGGKEMIVARFSPDSEPVPGAPFGSPRKQALYLLLLILGTALPFAQFLPWLRRHGLDLARFREELFANRISGFFGWDVLVAVPTLIVLILADRELRPAQRAIAVAGSLLGTSVGLPLYLFLREGHRRVAPGAR